MIAKLNCPSPLISDSLNAEAMMSLIASLVHEQGVAAIVSTHDPRMAAHADRIIEIRDGRISTA